MATESYSITDVIPIPYEPEEAAKYILALWKNPYRYLVVGERNFAGGDRTGQTALTAQQKVAFIRKHLARECIIGNYPLVLVKRGTEYKTLCGWIDIDLDAHAITDQLFPAGFTQDQYPFLRDAVKAAYARIILPELKHGFLKSLNESILGWYSGRGVHLQILLGKKYPNGGGYHLPSGDQARLLAMILGALLLRKWPGTIDIFPSASKLKGETSEGDLAARFAASPGKAVRFAFGGHRSLENYQCEIWWNTPTNALENRLDIAALAPDLEARFASIRSLARAEDRFYALSKNIQMEADAVGKIESLIIQAYQEYGMRFSRRAQETYRGEWESLDVRAALSKMSPCISFFLDDEGFLRPSAISNFTYLHRFEITREFAIAGGKRADAVRMYSRLPHFDANMTLKNVTAIFDWTKSAFHPMSCAKRRELFGEAASDLNLPAMCRQCFKFGQIFLPEPEEGQPDLRYGGPDERDEFGRPVHPVTVHSWQEVRAMIDGWLSSYEQSPSAQIHFISKSQRSRGTSTTLDAALEKIIYHPSPTTGSLVLFVVPIKMIAHKTLMGYDIDGNLTDSGAVAVRWQQRHPERPLRIAGITSNRDMCRLAASQELPEEITLFPELIKGNCRTCRYYPVAGMPPEPDGPGDCQLTYLLYNLDKIDVLYITYQKLYSMIRSQSRLYQDLLAEISRRAKIQFFDEVSHILNIGAASVELMHYLSPDLPLDYNVSLPALIDQAVTHILQTKLVHAQLSQSDQELQVFLRSVHNFAAQLVTRTSDRIRAEREAGNRDPLVIPEQNSIAIAVGDFIQIVSNLRLNFRSEVRHCRNQNQPLSPETYNAYRTALETIQVFANNYFLYIQHREHWGLVPKTEVFGLNGVTTILDFLKNSFATNQTLMISTDCIEPPISIARIFAHPQISVHYHSIGDPGQTTRKQKFIVHRGYSTSNPERIMRLRKAICALCNDNEDVFLMPTSKREFNNVIHSIDRTAKTVTFLIDGTLITKKYGQCDWIRGRETIGQSSHCRVAITWGDPSPPRGSQEHTAAFYHDQAFVNGNIRYVAQTIENWLAAGSYLQGLARVKDPAGIEYSVVHIFCMRPEKVEIMCQVREPQAGVYLADDPEGACFSKRFNGRPDPN